MIHYSCPILMILSLFLLDYSYGSTDLRGYSIHPDPRSRYKRNTLEQLDCGTKMEENGIELINKGIQAIYTEVESRNIEIKNNFYDALHKLYQLSETQPGVRTLVTTELYKFKYWLPDSAFKQYDSFNIACIHFYTTFYGVSEINKCLREHECTTKVLTQSEMYIAPYSAVLLSVLLYWPALVVETGTTYRGINLTQHEIDEYIVGLKFTWPSFISSSRHESGASKKQFTCKFVFDNSEITRWSPKRIAEYAHDPPQDEALYPSGVQFQVTRKQDNVNGQARINLKLINTGVNLYNSTAEIFCFVVQLLYIILR